MVGAGKCLFVVLPMDEKYSGQVKPITILIRIQKPKNKELAHACFSLIQSLKTPIGGMNNDVTNSFHGEPLEKDFKGRLQVGLPIVMNNMFQLRHVDGFTTANTIPAP